MSRERGQWRAPGFITGYWYFSRRTAFIVLVLACLGGWGAYRALGPGPSATKRAEKAIADAEQALAAAEARTDANRLRSRIQDAARELMAARAELRADRPDEARQHAIVSRSILQKILGGASGWDATLVDVEGRVEVQRSGRTSWENAAPGMKLTEGDFVKTGQSGSAEVMAADGTLYGVKADTLFEVRRTRSSGEVRPGSEVKVVAGEITTSTGQERSTIVTDSGTTNVGSKSRGAVTVDPSKETRFVLFDGSARVDTKAGGVDLGPREGVRIAATGEVAAERMRLPEAPQPLRPEEDSFFDSAAASRIKIAWAKVKGVSAYRFQIAKSRLFVADSILVDVPDRAKTEATIAVNDEGSYYWRVASLAGGLQSEWSTYRRFRVTSETAAESGKAPPALTVMPARVISDGLVEVSGKTEPGIRVTIGGERADTTADGSFRKIVPLRRSGTNTIAVKATNGAGQTTSKSVSVQIRVD